MGRILSFFGQEAQLVKALKQGDGKAQRLAYDKYSATMLALCYRYVGDRMTAEDIMIEGLMKVFEKISQFNLEGSLEGWIRKIMVNESLGYIRKQKRNLEEYPSDQIEIIPDYNFVEEKFNEEALLTLVNELPLGYRTVFNLYVIEGYSHKEISEIMEITESTSKSQLHRARTMLQRKLAEIEISFKKKINHEKASY